MVPPPGHSTSTRPAGCFFNAPSKSLEFNDKKDSTKTDASMEPVCLCGAYQELGNGVCRAGYYTGNPTPGATFESCRVTLPSADTSSNPALQNGATMSWFLSFSTPRPMRLPW